TICQQVTGSGGWPLTVVMTPERKPFLVGTYFPRISQYGRPGLIETLETLARLWREDRDALLDYSETMIQKSRKTGSPIREGELDFSIFQWAYHLLRQRFDKNYGGFGHAPKFPSPHNLMFFLRYGRLFNEPFALEMVKKTLDCMAQGGIYDHIGFGFSRYSTDNQWLVPHFEKMLYDNALLAMAYIEAYQALSEERFARVARGIFDYVLRDMTSPEGGFYSAEDADSEGVEGKFYVWAPDEIEKVLGREKGQEFCKVYGITAKGNFEGKSIPNLIKTPVNIIEEKQLELEASRQKLFNYREKRVHPYKDDKVLTAWNGLMIAALAKGYRVLGNRDLLDAAEKALGFILSTLKREDGRLLARYRDGEAAFPAYVDDYAFLVWGIIELYEATFKPSCLQEALNLTRSMMDLFWDNENGGLFFYGDDVEEQIIRPKEVYDGAIPSGNSVAAMNLIRLGRIAGRDDLEEKARQLFNAFEEEVNGYPPGYLHFLSALMFDILPGRQVVLVGKKEEEGMEELISVVNSRFLPNTILIHHEGNGNGQDKDKGITYHRVDGKATAYVCQDFTCQAPVTEPAPLRGLLGE
ncbi:MAG: thioredoxin domain-containing protein, partial [Chitinophagales bacterium]